MKNKLDLWHLRKTFTLVEAALLINELYPDDWPDEKLMTSKLPSFKAIYGLMLEDAVTEDNPRQISHETGEEFTSYVLQTDKPYVLKKLNFKDGFEIIVQKHMLKSWLDTKHLSARFFEDDTLPSFERPSKNDDNLEGRERKSIFRTIAALVETNLEGHEFTSKSALISHLVSRYDGYEGLSKSNLEKTFSEAAKILND